MKSIFDIGLDTWGRLYKAWIAYPADKSLKYNSAIHALNNVLSVLAVHQPFYI